MTKPDKSNDKCLAERYEFERKLGKNENVYDEYTKWYNENCRGCKYEYVICMKGEEGWD